MTYRIARLGWLPDPLDHRDYDIREPVAVRRLNELIPHTSRGAAATAGPSPAAGNFVVDLRRWCSPIEDQGAIGSCTAQAVVGALEYFERKARGSHIDASRLFVYRATRRFLGWEGRGDTGAFVRSAIKALRLFGAVPEEYWPYDEKRFDAEPEAFHYAFAQNFKAIEYYRVPENVEDLREVLKAGLPFVFGFTCFSSLFRPEVERSGLIPYPSRTDRQEGGHAVLAVGYTESHVLIRNSWGTTWGDGGYGYLPWSYFDGARPLATDCWVLLNATWSPTDEGEPVFAAPRATAKRRAPVFTPPEPPVDRERLEPRVRVSRGLDPTRALPFRFAAGALGAAADVNISLLESARAVSLYLSRLELQESFDFALFGSATNELYVTAVVWDLSGAAPRVFPSEAIAAGDLKTYRLRARESLDFVGDGIQLWPQSKVKGGLYVRLIVMESDGDVRALGASIAAIHKAVNDSPLPKALGALAALSGVSAPVLAAVTAAADLVTGLVATALQANGDDLVAVFDGTYGAENVSSTRVDEYEQGGAKVVLKFQVAAPV